MQPFNVRFEFLSPELLRFAQEGLIRVLQRIDDYCDGKLWIHRLYDDGNPNSQHYHGGAADGHIEGLSVIDQYVMLERFNPGGLGLYGKDVWNNPGFHFDIRTTSPEPAAKWGCVRKGEKRKYVALDKDFFKHLIRLEGG